MSETEGVVRFRASHVREGLDSARYGAGVRRLDGWRAILMRLGLVGRDPGRYGGAGYGNLSERIDAERFLITGTQTGARRRLGAGDVCIVERVDLAANTVVSRGPVPPSSESMTHAAVYAGWPAAGGVIHAHAPAIWRAARRLGLPATSSGAEYGTPELALEVRELCAGPGARRAGLFALEGHEDGVVGLGSSLDEAGIAVLRWLSRSG